jgi:hypothetical protein
VISRWVTKTNLVHDHVKIFIHPREPRHVRRLLQAIRCHIKGYLAGLKNDEKYDSNKDGARSDCRSREDSQTNRITCMKMIVFKTTKFCTHHWYINDRFKDDQILNFVAMRRRISHHWYINDCFNEESHITV